MFFSLPCRAIVINVSSYVFFVWLLFVGNPVGVIDNVFIEILFSYF